MISKQEMLPFLLTACPSFGPTWEAFFRDWQDDPNEMPLYIAPADYARHLIEFLERQNSDALRTAFAAIEQLHTDGDNYVREAATIGILESLQNDNLHTKATKPDDLLPFLGPESRRCWEELNRFWERTGTAPGD